MEILCCVREDRRGGWKEDGKTDIQEEGIRSREVSMYRCKHEGCHRYEVEGAEYTTPEGRRVKVVLIKCWCCKKVIGARPELISAMPQDVVPYHPLIP